MKGNTTVPQGGSLLDALHAAQNADGYLTTEAIRRLAKEYGREFTHVYETASFYSMFRFAPAGRHVIQICRNAPCHIAGAQQTISAFENALGVPMGSTSEDGRVTLKFTECIGQCQASPSVLIDGKLHTGVTADKVPALVRPLT